MSGESSEGATFPFGRPSTERPARPAVFGRAELFVLGVYSSALHVRWCRPDRVVRVQALAVDNEPEVFWDGANATERVERWRREVGWQEAWGTATAAMNGTSGRAVVDEVLRPLGVGPEEIFFTDCVRRYFVKTGENSQRQAIDDVYAPFAAARGLPAARLPARPTPAGLVRLAAAEDRGSLGAQLAACGATDVVTLGQEAADVFALLAGVERVRLRADAETYGAPSPFRLDGVEGTWRALKHPGQRGRAWAQRHAVWIESSTS